MLDWAAEQETSGFTHPVLEIDCIFTLGMLGRFDEARTRSRALQAQLEDRGASVALALALGMQAPQIEQLAGDPTAALEFSKRGCAMLEKSGDRSWLSTALGFQGQIHYELGDFDAAFEAARRGEELGASDDAITQMLGRQVQAKVLARRGSFDEAERLAREACKMGDAVDMSVSKGEAYEDLGHVLYLTGKTAEAERAVERAIEIYDAKGAVAMTDRARRMLAMTDS
jgi:tetratricopeptide (TPR) repeat protein